MREMLQILRAWVRENPWRLLYLIPYLLIPFLVEPVYRLLDYITALMM